MTDDEAFLNAIIADPDDDVRRLAFADWLEENEHDDRAEFIRLQCLGADPNRQLELLETHRAEWEIPHVQGKQVFRRGFVEQLHMAAEQFVLHAERIGRSAPVVDLRLIVAQSFIPAVAAVSWLSRLQGLELSNNVSLGGRLREMFPRNRFPKLRTLTLRNNQLWPEDVGVLVELAAGLPMLERLDVSGNPVSADGATRLADSAHLRGLKSLILRADEIDYTYRMHAAGAGALARSKTLTRLEVLNLAGQYIGDAGFRSLIRSPVLAEVVDLDVSRCEIGEIGFDWAEALIDSPFVGRLRRLNVSRNVIDTAAARVLAAWTHLGSGCVVDLQQCEFRGGARECLERSEYSPRFVLTPELTAGEFE